MKVRFWMFTLCLLTGLSSVLAQTITVRGNVVDENGEALPGVSIVPKSAPKTGTVSNIDGKFTISVRNGEKLTFSFMGLYEPRVGRRTPDGRADGTLRPNVERRCCGGLHGT